MNQYVMDTNHVSVMIMESATLVSRISAAGGKDAMSITIPSIADLWYVVLNSGRQQPNINDIETILDGLGRWDFSESSTFELGRIKELVRRMGRPIPDGDIQIAAIARANGLTILTADAPCSNIYDSLTENWLA